jgi:Flp pilus assembly protein TadG
LGRAAADRGWALARSAVRANRPIAGCLPAASLRSQRGAVAIVFALSLPVLVGLAALAIDVSRLWVIRSELQAAADACALAAVSQLRGGTGTLTTLARAEAHGLALSDRNAQNVNGVARPDASINRVDFQSRTLDSTTLVVRFADTASGPWVRAADASTALAARANHARCVSDAGGVPLYLAGAIGINHFFSLSAGATAALVPSQANCSFPLGVCKIAGTHADSNTPFGLVIGTWLREPASSGSKRFQSGNFGWIDFDPPKGGADELGERIAGQGSCALRTGVQVGESGLKSSAYGAWNARFGLYRSGGPTPASSPGDFSGVAYTERSWPRKHSAYSGSGGGSASNFLVSRANFSPYQGNSASGVNVNFSTNWSPSQRRSQGRDRRLVVAPIIDCAVWDESGSARPAIEGWACALLLSPIATSGKSSPGQIEYLGLASAAGSPCASGGVPGSPSSAGPLVPVLVE